MMKQRCFSILLLTFLFPVFTSGCSTAGTVRLCDYQHIRIPEDVLEITDEDVQADVSLDMFVFNVLLPKPENADFAEEGDAVKVSVSIGGDEAQELDIIAGSSPFGESFEECLLGKRAGEAFDFSFDGETGHAVILSVSTYARTLTDDIARRYYDCVSAEDAVRRIKEEIAEARIFDAVYPEIVNNSMINGYEKERAAYADRAIDTLLHKAEHEGYPAGKIDDYLKDEMDTTLAEYRQSMESFYDVYLIMCELMEAEGVHVTEKEFDAFCEREFGGAYDKTVPDSELFGPMGREYAMYNLYYFERCPKALIKYYRDLFQM